MHARLSLRISLLLCAILTATMGTQPAFAARPNIVLIMADDMGFSDIGCYGSEIQTPNLDRLAANGLRFTQFYNTSRCCPTRASLMTGLYPHQAGVGHMMSDMGHDGYRGDLNEQCVTIAEVLRLAGYRTYMAGKWHVTKQVGHWSGNLRLNSRHNWPRQRGFQRFFGTIHGAGSFYDPISLTEENTPTVPVASGFFYTDAINDRTAEYIRSHQRLFPHQPFFCYVAHTAPHWPLHAKPKDIAKYKGVYDRGWDSLRADRRERMIKMGLIQEEWGLSERDPSIGPWDEAENKAWEARRMEVYAAQIDSLDQGVGRIIEALEETRQLENTLIFFLADNGGCAEELTPSWRGLHIPKSRLDRGPVQIGNDPNVMPGPEETYQSYGVPWANASNTPFRRYKHWVHEGGIATPLIVHWPNAIERRGAFERQPGHLIDIMATCVDVADAAYPSEFKGRSILPMEGTSLMPACLGEDLGQRTLFWEHEGNRAIRQGHWKLVSRYRDDWELFYMPDDRTELNDLSKDFPDITRTLAAEFNQWAERAKVMDWATLTRRR